MILFILFVLFATAAALSVRFGVDSREGSSDPRRAEYPVGIS